jgi:hypothetical protein
VNLETPSQAGAEPGKKVAGVKIEEALICLAKRKKRKERRGANLQLTVTIIQNSKSDINKNDYNQCIIINQNLLTKVVTSSFLGLCDFSSSESGL